MFDTLKKRFFRFSEIVGEILILFAKSFKFIFVRPLNFKMVLSHIYVDGLKSIPVIFLTSVFTGGVLALQSFFGLLRFGAETFTGSLVGVSLTRELIPVLSGLMLAGRIGASYSAEIGTMKVSEQIDALYTFGVNPVKYLVTPRLIALIIIVPLLTLFGDFVGIWGGRFVVDIICNQNPKLYDSQLLSALEFFDIVSGMIKSIFFGITIAVIGSYFGISAEGGAKGVGKATTISVVTASIIILISDFFWSKILPFSLK